MFIIVGKNALGSVIHAVKGEESEVWDDLNGASTIDITPILQKLPTDAPVYLQITECKSEVELSDKVRTLIESGVDYPFAPPGITFVPDGEGLGSVPSNRKRVEAKSKTNKTDVGKCSRCGGNKLKLVPGIKPSICYNCAEIDLHIAAKAKADNNNED